MQKVENKKKESSIPLQKRVADPTKSFLTKYQELAVGEGNISALLKYEIITMLFSGIPGALGFFLRKYFYKFLLNDIGNNVIFGKYINITNPRKIKIGSNCLIGDYCELDAKYRRGEIIIGDNVTIGRNTLIRTRGGCLKIGDNSAIGANCDLVARESTLKIERNHLMAAYCYLSTGYRDYSDRKVPINTQPITSKDILIEEDVWLGARVTVLAGSVIRKGSVIGACSLVNHEIGEYSVAVGIPAKKIKSR